MSVQSENRPNGITTSLLHTYTVLILSITTYVHTVNVYVEMYAITKVSNNTVIPPITHFSYH